MDLKQRLNSVIKKDRDPKYLNQVLKSDLFYLLNNYFEIAFEDIQIDTKIIEDKYQININARGDRIKMFNVLPE